MKILSCGAGMQSTALALMACEQAITGASLYPDVPIYDAIIFCDLGLEPVWVKQQVEFILFVCEEAGIPFYTLDTPLTRTFYRILGSAAPSASRGGH